MALKAGDDTISQIIKHQRRSPEPIDCAGLDVYLLEEDLKDVRAQIMLCLLNNVEAGYNKAQIAYRQWMDYMTGVIWQSAYSFLSCLRCSKAYIIVSGSKIMAGKQRSSVWLQNMFAG